MTFDEQLEETLRHEGKYQKWKEDSGNWLDGRLVGTMYGITAPRLAQHWGRRDITQSDMRNLDIDTARDIYRQRYYDAARIGLLPDQLEGKTFDMCVNHGTHWGVKLMQRAIRAFEPEIETDGKIGPQTVRLAYKAAREHGPRAIVNAAVEVRNRYYMAIIRNRPSQARFKRGWLRRSNSFTNTADIYFKPDAQTPWLEQPVEHAKPETEIVSKPNVADFGFIAQLGQILSGWLQVFAGRSKQA